MSVTEELLKKGEKAKQSIRREIEHMNDVIALMEDGVDKHPDKKHLLDDARSYIVKLENQIKVVESVENLMKLTDNVVVVKEDGDEIKVEQEHKELH